MMRTPVRVIALNGSPRQEGNTATLMSWVADGCKDPGADVEWVHVAAQDIGHCRGCFGCLREGRCVVVDGFGEVRERLLSAPAIIVGSPQYAGGPTAQLKALMDRLTLLNLFTGSFEDHWSVGAVTSGVAPNGGVARDLSRFFGRSVGAIGAKTATTAHGYRPLSAAHPPALPAQARSLGARLVSAAAAAPNRPAPRGLSDKLFASWIGFLRLKFLHPMMRNNPGQFQGAIEINWPDRSDGRQAGQ